MGRPDSTKIFTIELSAQSQDAESFLERKRSDRDDFARLPKPAPRRSSLAQ